MNKIIIFMVLMFSCFLLFGQNIDTYFSYSEIVSANPRAAFSLGGGSPSNINLNRVPSRLGTQFNVFIEVGLEETWDRLKKAYNLNPPEDWIVGGITKNELLDYFALARNMDNAQILFITKAHAELYAIFRQDWAVFVQDPKGILKKN